MTASHKAAAGVFDPARVSRAVACTALTAVLAVVFGLSVMVEVSNAQGGVPQADGAAVLSHTAAAAPTAA